MINLGGEFVPEEILNNIKFTGTTEHFEYYYGEILYRGFIVSKYYFSPKRSGGKFRTRKKFNGEIIEDRQFARFVRKVIKEVLK